LRRLVSNPLAPLLLFSLTASAISAAYLFAGRSPTQTFDSVVQLSWAVLVVFWVVIDARKGHRIPCFDFGLFCYLFLPITLPWYCFWSRGWRGTFLILAIYGLGVLPYFTQSIVWEMLYG
jgi:hypothetical protein